MHARAHLRSASSEPHVASFPPFDGASKQRLSGPRRSGTQTPPCEPTGTAGGCGPRRGGHRREKTATRSGGGHGKQTTVGVCVTVSSYTSLEDGNIGHRERYFSKMATEVFSLLPLRTKIRTAGSQFSIVLPLSTEHAILAFCFLIR